MTVFLRYKKTIIFMVFFAMLTCKIFYGARMEYLLAEGLLKNGRYLSAITHYQRAMKWHIPAIGYTDISAQRLWEIGGRMERSGDIKMALIAYRNLRSGFYSVRSFYTPGEEWIDKCDKKISVLSGNEEVYRSGAPLMAGTASILLGMFGWITCALFFILKMGGYKTSSGKKIAFSIVVLFILCYAVWVMGILRA